MTARPAAAKVLVASDNASDALQIAEQIGKEYAHVRSSTDPAAAVADFDEFRPDVVLLAFDSLDKAQRYALGLYRQSAVVATYRHATVVLCTREEVGAAFALCKSGHFDDYVLHWPHAQDGQRLAMSIWNAARGLAALTAGPNRQELDRHAQQVMAVDSLLKEELSAGAVRLGGATGAMQAAEQAVGAAIDELSQRLAGPERTGTDATKSRAGLAQELSRLKNDGVATIFKTGAATAASIAAWPGEMQDRLDPHLARLRTFATSVEGAPRTVLVVDDDAFARRLIAKALEDQGYSLEFAEDGAAALRLLRRVHPMLVLMDVRLPDTDGVTLTRKLKAAPHLADIPVLMLTGDARRDTLTDSVGAGAAGFIVKPFTRDSLLRQIARVLNADR